MQGPSNRCKAAILPVFDCILHPIKCRALDFGEIWPPSDSEIEPNVGYDEKYTLGVLNHLVQDSSHTIVLCFGLISQSIRGPKSSEVDLTLLT